MKMEHESPSELEGKLRMYTFARVVSQGSFMGGDNQKKGFKSTVFIDTGTPPWTRQQTIEPIMSNPRTLRHVPQRNLKQT
jgi:hypothetical protein